MSRRRFMLSGAGALAATLNAGSAWPQAAVHKSQQALEPWLPTPDFLRTLPRLLELSAVPGLALGVVEGGRVWKRGFGRADLQAGTATSDDTVFEAASLGKPLFAYAVLRLADAGRLDLDRPLHHYLPLAEAKDPRVRRITARHVLSHTTGLPNWRKESGLLVPTSDPGSKFSYSGEAFVYLQRTVERITNTPFNRFMDEQVFGPLGMRQTSFVWRPEFEPRMAAGYDENATRLDVYAAVGRKAAGLAHQWSKPLADWRYEDAIRAVPLIAPHWPPLPVFMAPNAAASLLTTVEDYVKFLTRVVARPPAPGLELGDATRRAMVAPHVKLNSALSWGLGWGLEEDEYGTFLWHWGANMSFRNFVVADPANGRAAVVLTNSLNGPKLYQRVIAAVTGHDHPAFLWPYI